MIRRAPLVALLSACAALTGEAHAQPSSEDARALELEEVLARVARDHPRIRAALAARREAVASLRAARGAFDPRLTAEARLRSGGFYELRRVDVELRQPTPFYGAEVFTGYRLGLGESAERYPTYLPDETLAYGEVRGGIELPILRNGRFDERRAARLAAEQRIAEAEAAEGLTRLDLVGLASDAYLEWLAAGYRVRIAQALTRLAEARDAQVEARVRAGAIPAIDRVESRRMVLERRDLEVQSRRELERKAYQLALYLPTDGPLAPPGLERVPARLDARELALPPAPALVSRVLACHPELRQLRANLRALEIEADLARNRGLPDLSARFQVSRDLGDEDRNITLGGTVFEGQLSFAMPLGLRTPLGEAAGARARRDAAAAELEWARDQVERAVLDALSRLRAARERVALTDETYEAAEALAEGERRRFAAGASTLLVLNIREQGAAEARMRLVEAFAEARRAEIRAAALAGVDCR